MPRYDKFTPTHPLPKLTDQAKSYQVVSAFLAQKANKENIARLTCQLKNKGDHAEVSEAFRTLFRTAPFYERVVWGNSCPDEVADLGNGDNSLFFEPESLEREVSWAVMGLRPFKGELVKFVALREQVERHILLGNYQEANQLLQDSIKQFGYSIWYYEMRLTIDGCQDHIEESFSLLTTVNEAYTKVGRKEIVPIILQDLCNRSISRSPLQYDNLLVSHFKRNRTDGNRFDYYLFRLNYYQYYDLENLSEMIEMDHMNAAVDRYTTLLYVLRSWYVNKEKQRNKVLQYAKQLYNITGDPQLLPFMALDQRATLPDSYYDSSFVAILDSYYTGQYSECSALCRTYLEHDPSNLYVVKLYCRSLMFLGNGFHPITSNPDCLLQTIASNTYHVMVAKENKEYVENLNITLKNVYGLRIAAALDHFVKSEQREPHADMMSYLSLLQFDPFFIKAFTDEVQQKNYLQKGLQHIPGSPAIEYRKQCVERNIREDSPVVAYIRNVDTAKITFERKDYKLALEQWQTIFDSNHDSIPTAQTAAEYIFHSLVALGTEYRKQAVRFYVDSYLENPAYVSKVVTRQFLEDIKQSRYDGLNTELNLLIFVFLNAVKYPQKQFVLERYCKFERVVYPSQLIQKLSANNDKQKVELFYSILLTDDILYHHYKLKSTIAVLDEKLKIVNFLKSEYPNNQKYSRIFTELMHEIVAYRGMNKMDDSKIFVNEDAVMKYELCDIEPLYDRFCKQAALAREGHQVLLLGEFSLSGLKEVIEDETTYSTDAVADVAMELFCIIRRAFLKSRFGLSTYLSTRIRHGVFEGEVRSFLRGLELILSTDCGEYVASGTRWHNRYHLDSKARNILNQALIQFSRATDDLIINFKESVIQIRVDNDDPNSGLFCYEQPKDIVRAKLMEIESQSKDAKDFCRKVMSWLWEITEQCLENVRDKVQTELKPSYTQNITELEHKIELLDSHATLQADLHTAINKAREELSTRLAKVEKWFYRQEAKPENFHITDHINMALDTIQKYSPDVNVKADGTAPTQEILFHADYSASMFDLLTIFLSNVFKYSRVEMVRPLLFDVILEDDDIMHLHIENNLPENTDEDELNKDIQSRISNEKLIQKEGGSGLAKAMNIVKYDFGDTRNDYTIIAKDGKCTTDVYIHLSNMIVS